MPPSFDRSVFTIAWWIGMAALVVLVVTGIWLSFVYQPAPSDAWDDLGLGGDSPSALITWAHVAAAWTIAGAAAVGGVAGLLDARRRPFSRVAMVLTLPAIWLSIQLGRMLPWDQLALEAVTVNGNLSGVNIGAILRDDLRFLLIDGREVEPDAYLATFIAHLVIAALVVAGWLILRTIGAASSAEPPSEGMDSGVERPAEPMRDRGPAPR